MNLSNEQWSLINPLIPPPPARPDGRGRPWVDDRPVLDGILYILRTGAPWHFLPPEYPPHQTCHRRYQYWKSAGVIADILKALFKDLHDRGGLDVTRCFSDGTVEIVPLKGGRMELIADPALQYTWQLDVIVLFIAYLQDIIRLQQSSRRLVKFQPRHAHNE